MTELNLMALTIAIKTEQEKKYRSKNLQSQNQFSTGGFPKISRIIDIRFLTGGPSYLKFLANLYGCNVFVIDSFPLINNKSNIMTMRIKYFLTSTLLFFILMMSLITLN